ncbi:MAG TPA: M20/M25/M40 family metallo-hydrolase [Telluria sp.]|nr:M20/M25/M40 family metallo-hydrolase [Telluria sp.]
MLLKKFVLTAALAAAFAGPAFAADTLSDKELQTAAALRDAALTGNLSYRILESLTTEVGPRMAGSPNDARAVAWAEAKFRELGFDKVWKEPVTFPVWRRGHETAEVVSPYPQPLLVTALGFSVGTPAEGVSADVVRFATLKDLMAAPDGAVRGKIAFIDHKMQKSSDYGSVQAGRSNGASEAAKKGAVALVIRSVGTDSHRFPHTGMMRYQQDVPKIPAAAVSNPDADLLVRMLERGKPVKLKLRLGALNEGSYTSYNVIGEMTGSEKPDEYVLIGGHLDSWDLGTGAIDDGAGVAITMAAAEFIKRQGLRPKRSIRVVLYANEEQGLIGGKAYHDAHSKEIHKIQAAAEADSGQGPVIKFSSYVQPAALPVVKQMADVLKPLGVETGGNDAHPGPDMGVLKNAGAASFGLGLKNDDYFDLHHTPDDTFDKIEPARINQTAAAYAAFAWMAAQAPVSFGSGQDALRAMKAVSQ